MQGLQSIHFAYMIRGMCKFLKEDFEDSGKTQAECGAELGVTQATFSRWVSGRISSTKALAAARLFNQSPSRYRPDVFGQ